MMKGASSHFGMELGVPIMMMKMMIMTMMRLPRGKRRRNQSVRRREMMRAVCLLHSFREKNGDGGVAGRIILKV
eukprot:scaffold6947_cov172-Skeletonema_dohrnii-CCMP3373.AAC.2